MWVRSLDWKAPLEEGPTLTPVFVPGESQGQRNLVGYSPRSCQESDISERLSKAQYRMLMKLLAFFRPFQSSENNTICIILTNRMYTAE